MARKLGLCFVACFLAVFRRAKASPQAPTAPFAQRRGRAGEQVGVLVGHEYCRSPLAQGVFEDVPRREGLEDEVCVDSTGAGSWHLGSPPDDRAQGSASAHGLELSAQRARRISPEDCEDFDYILTMDEVNYRTAASPCRRRRGAALPRLRCGESEVPDPYGGWPGASITSSTSWKVPRKGYWKTSASGTWTAGPGRGPRPKKGAQGCACAS